MLIYNVLYSCITQYTIHCSIFKQSYIAFGYCYDGPKGCIPPAIDFFLGVLIIIDYNTVFGLEQKNLPQLVNASHHLLLPTLDAHLY